VVPPSWLGSKAKEVKKSDFSFPAQSFPPGCLLEKNGPHLSRSSECDLRWEGLSPLHMVRAVEALSFLLIVFRPLEGSKKVLSAITLRGLLPSSCQGPLRLYTLQKSRYPPSQRSHKVLLSTYGPNCTPLHHPHIEKVERRPSLPLPSLCFSPKTYRRNRDHGCSATLPLEHPDWWRGQLFGCKM